MAAAPNLDVNVIKKFHPLDSLSIDKVKEVIEKSAVQKIPAGQVLFKRGDRDKWTVYLLTGKIELKSADGKRQIIEAGSDAAHSPIADEIPRPASAKAKTDISILIIDKDLLDILMNWNAPSSIEVNELDDDEDWMTRFLQSNAFLQLPAANIQALMMRLQAPLARGETIIRENDANDDKFYIIQQGRCVVTKTSPTSGEQVPLAELRLGDGFGEEVLITGGIRGASVTMKTDGVILSLDKKDFIELLVELLIHRIKLEEVKTLKEDQYQLIDVRNEDEHQTNGLDNSINIPINLIRTQLDQLSPEKHYIAYSGHENRSSAAAFLFIQQGYNCSIIENSIGEADITRSAVTEEKFPEAPTPASSAETEALKAEKITSPEIEAARKEAELMATDLRSEAQLALQEARRAQQTELALKAAQLKAVQLESQTLEQWQTSAELEKIKQQKEEMEQHLPAPVPQTALSMMT